MATWRTWQAVLAFLVILASASCPHVTRPKEPICSGEHPEHLEPGCRLLV